MKIVITGASGFVGQHLTRELRDHGHELLLVDRHRPPRGTDVSDFLRRDLRDPFDDVLDWARPDLVVHLAAHVGRLFGEDENESAVKDNALVTTLLARACGERGVRVAYTSTSEVYGDRGNRVCREGDPLDVLPHNLYGLSKRWGEEVLRLYGEPVIFRLSMPYGPGAPPGRGRRALDTMLWQAFHRMPIAVHRDSERSWCWVDDTVRGLRMVIESGRGGAWNVGRDDAPVPMLELARRCCELTGADADELIRVVDPPHRQTVVKRLATDKLRSLGWRPEVDLEEGLERMLDWVVRYDRNGKVEVEAA
jgi:nucleoside-diphosphate-sugar epimerase